MSEKKTSTVYEAHNGWLFLVGGSNNVLDIFSGKLDSANWIGGWANLIKKRADYAKKYDIEYCHVSAPEKLSVYSRFLGGEIKECINLNSAPSKLIEDRIDKSYRQFYINPTSYLRQQSNDYKVYHETDTHWSFLGAFSVFQLIMSRLGYSIDAGVSLDVTPVGECVMDLGGKLSSARKEKVFFYEPRSSVKRTYVNELVEYKEINRKENEPGLHVGSIVKFTNENAIHTKKVLIFGDSFSEYRPQLLTGLFAEHFSEVMFVWGLNLDYDLVEEFRPDILITESAERFMPFNVPNDSLNYKKLVSSTLNNIMK